MEIADIAKLKDYSTARKFAKNQVIITEGDTMPYSMFIVLKGGVRVIKNLGEFGQSVVANLGPGDFFGEMSLFLSEPRKASVIASEETITLEINQTNVYEVIENNPTLLYSILKTLCHRIDSLNDRVRSFGHN